MAHKRQKKNVYRREWDVDNLLVDESSLLSEVDQLFSKNITLKNREQKWQLPQRDVFLCEGTFTIDKLLAFKDELNATKSLLNDMDIEKWHQHTRWMHKGGLVVKNLRDHVNAEMCTQAWAKFKEILGTYNLISSQAQETKQFNSVHLCEAPGAFIACMNQHLKNNIPEVKWGWIGATLNPYYEGNDLNAMLDDDSFITETRQHWDFGSDGTGNIMDLKNLIHLKKNCENMGPVHLVTADGSINCADNPGEQEQVVSQLILCESLAAIELLSTGGNYVFKMFTALECHMICMLYLLACVFEEMHFIKPATSKAGNSEVYIICLGYHGNIHPEFHAVLSSIYNSNIPDRALLPLQAIPGDFIDRLFECQSYFIEKQKEEILDNIRMFGFMSKEDKHHLYRVKNQAVEEYFSRFNVKPLLKGNRTVQTCYLDGIQRAHNSDGRDFHLFSNRRKQGTYNERDQHSWLEVIIQDGHYQPSTSTSLTEFCKSNEGTKLIHLSPDDIEWLETPSKTRFTFSLTKGKKVTKVLNSRFCSSFSITTLNTALDNASKSTQELFKKLAMRLTLCNGNINQCYLCPVVILERLVGFTQQPNITSLLLGQPLLCQCLNNFLQSQDMKVSSGNPCPEERFDLVLVPGLDDHEVHMALWDSKKPPLEVITKPKLLEQSIIALKALKPGGTFICRMFSSLTRFTVGLLYILHHVFQRIAIVNTPSGSPCICQHHLVCKGFKGCDKSFIDPLIQARQLIDSCDEEEDLLEIVDMKCLYEERFYSFIFRMNEQFADLQISSILNLELFSADTVESQYKVLCEEIRKHFELPTYSKFADV